MADERSITLEVFRYDPEESSHAAEGDGHVSPSTSTPRFDSYEVPYHEHWVVLDALNHVKNELDGTLAYRWSCRMGVCGSCGMMVNGQPRLTCNAFLKEYLPGPIRIEPLAYFPVERDLIIDLDGFLEKLTAVKPWLIRKEEKSLDEGEYLQSPNALASYKQYSMCINCMLCYSSCPVVGEDENFLGPAAIALAQRYNYDSRDQGAEERADALGADEGAWGCTFVGECSRVCPKNVDPAGAIQRAKVDSMKGWYKRLLMPWGQR